MLDDLYQADTNAALDDLVRRPPTPRAQPPKFSAWNLLTAVPRGLTVAGMETGAMVPDLAEGIGNVFTRATVDLLPEPRGGGGDEFRQREKERAQGASSVEGDVIRRASRDFMPDPQTAHGAEQAVFGFARFGAKAVGSVALAGPAAGAAIVATDEGLTAADELRQQGVDLETRTKVGAVTGVLSGVGAVLPVAGRTTAQTAALVVAGGPASFITQQAATRQILQDADYTKLADQIDPLDPVGLAVSTLVPAGFGVWAMRGMRKGAAKAGEPLGKTEQLPPEAAPVQAEPATPRPTPEQVDAARVEMLTQHVESTRLTPVEDAAGARAHDEAMARAMDQLASGERVDVSDVAPVPRAAPTDTTEFKAWFGGSKVVDEQGAPLVVYHGTNADVSDFDLSRSGSFGANFGRAAFFSSDPSVAGSYAARWMGSADFIAAKAAHDAALSEYARAVSNHGKASQEASKAKRAAEAAGAAAKKAAGAVENMAAPSEGANLVPVYLSLRNPLEIDAQGKSWASVNEQAMKAAIEGGHDGVIIRNVEDSANTTARRPSTVYAVFDPKRIKSAIGNSGKFDPSSPSLTDSRFASWADQINAAIDDIRAAAKEAANVQDAPQARADAPATAERQPAEAAQPQRADAQGPGAARAGEQGGGVPRAGGDATEAAVVSQRLADIAQQFPDLTVQMDGMAEPVKLSDFLAQVQREAMEGTDDALGGNDAPLMQVAASCFLLNGA